MYYTRGLKLKTSAGRIVKPKLRKYGKLLRKRLSLNSNWLWNKKNIHTSAKNMIILSQICFFQFMKEDAGRTSTSGGPHAARGQRVWDRCTRLLKYFNFVLSYKVDAIIFKAIFSAIFCWRLFFSKIPFS